MIRGIFTILVLVCMVQAEFILNDISLSDQEVAECRHADARSNQAGGRLTAAALRNYMTRNNIKIVVDKGDVSASQRFGNEGISTGHSCSVTAEAQNIVARVSMVPGTVELGPEGVVYVDEVKNSIAVADVTHALSVTLNIRVWGGYRFFGRCKKYARKTCHTDGYSQGTNRVSVNLAASNVMVECIGGEEHLTFNINANVIDERKQATYSPVEVGKRSGCNIRVLGVRVASINSKIQSYASRYVNSNSHRFHELRSSRMVAELERKLGVQLGSTVTLKIKDSAGTPRTCSR